VKSELETVLPVYIIGDSIRCPTAIWFFREKWTARGSWRDRNIFRLTAHDFFNPATGEFHPDFIAFWSSKASSRRSLQTSCRRTRSILPSQRPRAVGAATASSSCVGEIDVRGPVLQLLKDDYDFVRFRNEASC